MGAKLKSALMRALRLAIDAAVPAALGSMLSDLGNEKILGVSLTILIGVVGKLLRMFIPQEYQKYIIF